MASAAYLVDKSALARLARPEVEAQLAPLLLSGQLARCGAVTLEVLFSARTYADFVQIHEELQSMASVAMAEADFGRAIEVMKLLARRGHHRATGIPDLLIAAAAERAGLCLLHYDRDFELIASVTGQKAKWVVPPGSVP